MEIQKADSRARRRALITVLAAAVIFCLFAVLGLESAIEDFVTDQLSRRPFLLPIAGTVMVLPLALFALYLFYQGSQICSTRRYPRMGQKVIRDTPVLTGPAAVKRGRFVQVLAVLLFVIVACVPILLWEIAHLLSEA